jgi:two-component system, cell cycle sensor histidine kinase and response regulator CckA
MKASLHILHLEDNPFDAEIVSATLAADDIDCELVRVETRDQFITAIESKCFDLILADCTLPSFDGMTALAITRETCPETPFIFISGWLGEEVAIETLKNGATDYVLKNRMSRLCPSVRRALQEVEQKKERRRAEEALQSSQRFAQQIADASPNLLYLYDVVKQSNAYINHTISKITRYSMEEIHGQKAAFLSTLLHPDDVARVCEQVKRWETLEDNEIVEMEYRLKRSDNDWRWLHSSHTVFSRTPEGKPHLILGTAQDVTERKRLEEQLHHAQKMESIGTLAGGIAHDFNNLLTAIIGNAQLGLSNIADNDPTKDRLIEIEKAGKRAGELTRQLLIFSRRQKIERRLININDTIGDFLKMLHRIIGEDVEIRFLTDAGLPMVLIDPGQIEQVIMNLAVNARDAMSGGGQLIIEIHTVTLDSLYCQEHAFVTPGQYVQIILSDTGSGIDAETQQRIFEPFFTTKDVGKGTGLGLATVYGIVKQHDGFIQVYSEVGHGTTFKIYLPMSQNTGDPTLPEVQQAKPVRGSETILVVEDEVGLRRLAKEVLSELGYTVLTAEDGKQALEIYEASKNQIDLMLVDVVMPRMGGREVYERLQQMGSRVPTIFMTGYSTEMFQSNFIEDKSAALIQKPYSPASLGHKVREVLNASRSI